MCFVTWIRFTELKGQDVAIDRQARTDVPLMSEAWSSSRCQMPQTDLDERSLTVFSEIALPAYLTTDSFYSFHFKLAKTPVSLFGIAW